MALVTGHLLLHMMRALLTMLPLPSPQELLAQQSEDDRQHMEKLLTALGIPPLCEELRELGMDLRQGIQQVLDGQAKFFNAMMQEFEKLETRGAGHSVPYRSYTSAQVYAATNDYADTNKLGSGGFGNVYKGVLDDTPVVIKVTAVCACLVQHAHQRTARPLAA